MQQKDVIYIDVEDDITAIIGKVKAAKEKIVALVPPKRTGVLQSAVNLRLLARAATNADKKLVLITGNAALSSLAASAKIPVAKNLQSRPEVPEIKSFDNNEEDVIEGDKLPVGDHARTAGSDNEEVIVPPTTIEGIDISDEKPKATRAAKKKGGIKVPDFGTFRKKLILGVIGGVLLLAFLIWAIWFAPHGTVVISAKTTPQSLSTPVTLGADVTTDAEEGLIQAIQKQEKVTQSVDFDATGSEDRGEKATGQVKLTALSLTPKTVPAGTTLTADGGLTFITNSTVIIPAASFGPGCFPTACPTSVTTGVTATAGGTKYNSADGSLSGAPSGVTAEFTGPTSGGTEKIVKIVLQADVEKAKAKLADQNKDEMKEKVKALFDDSDFVIDNSLTINGEDAVSSPAIGEEASNGKVKLTREMTYTMTGIAKSELDTYLDAAFKNTLTDENSQRIYDNGSSKATFADFKSGERSATATLETTAQIGPRIDDEEIKEQVKGKRFGEIQGDLKAIDGVSDVDLKLTPFWVQGVPDDINKITIEFKLLEND